MIKKILTGVVSGFLNGFFGSGGGTVIVPSLEFVHKVEEHKAHATAILIILPLSIMSTIIYLNNGQIDLISALKVGIGSILGSIVGAKLLNKLSGNMLRKFFGVVLIVAALRMVF
ncbi:MAG: sulfite exporter TauE/SafE family protein [Clostridia bacterium]|nr:sulfite exporter TauE/SafE family protein [Clostridia bacterium]